MHKPKPVNPKQLKIIHPDFRPLARRRVLHKEIENLNYIYDTNLK